MRGREGEKETGRERGERGGEGENRTPSHETFSNTFILVHTSHCGSKVSHDVSA